MFISVLYFHLAFLSWIGLDWIGLGLDWIGIGIGLGLDWDWIGIGLGLGLDIDIVYPLFSLKFLDSSLSKNLSEKRGYTISINN